MKRDYFKMLVQKKDRTKEEEKMLVEFYDEHEKQNQQISILVQAAKKKEESIAMKEKELSFVNTKLLEERINGMKSQQNLLMHIISMMMGVKPDPKNIMSPPITDNTMNGGTAQI